MGTFLKSSEEATDLYLSNTKEGQGVKGTKICQLSQKGNLSGWTSQFSNDVGGVLSS